MLWFQDVRRNCEIRKRYQRIPLDFSDTVHNSNIFFLLFFFGFFCFSFFFFSSFCFLFVSMFVLFFFKLEIYILIHIRRYGRVSDRKSFTRAIYRYNTTSLLWDQKNLLKLPLSEDACLEKVLLKYVCNVRSISND